MNGSAKPFYSKGNNAPYMGQLAEREPMIWDSVQLLMKGINNRSGDTQQMVEVAMHVGEVLEQTRVMYNEAVVSRDAAYHRFQQAENKLRQVGNIVQRFVNVKEPVVASDGYTYEREDITSYYKECQATNSKAYSQQTREELDEVFFSNVSLSRLVDLLKKIQAPELHPPMNRGLIPSVSAGRMSWGEEDVKRPMDMVPASVGNMHQGNPRRYDNHKMKGSHGKHPCLRVYGTCNFMEDCTFANYPYEACLNYIKGKCRFGDSCKELHVDRNDTTFLNPRSSANNNNATSNTTKEEAKANDVVEKDGDSSAEKSATPKKASN